MVVLFPAAAGVVDFAAIVHAVVVGSVVVAVVFVAVTISVVLEFGFPFDD